MKPASGSPIKYPLRERSELRHCGHPTAPVHTVGLSVNVCRLPTDARVAANGDFVKVLVNACHVLLFDELSIFTVSGRQMCHDHCYMLRCTTSSVPPILARPNARNSSGEVRTKQASLSSGHAMGLNTNSKRDAEVLHETETRDVQWLDSCISSADGTRCLYRGVVSGSTRKSASRHAGHRNRTEAAEEIACANVFSTRPVLSVV